MKAKLEELYDGVEVRDLAPVLKRLRGVKTAEEIAQYLDAILGAMKVGAPERLIASRVAAFGSGAILRSPRSSVRSPAEPSKIVVSKPRCSAI